MGLLDRTRQTNVDYVPGGAQPSAHQGDTLPDRRVEHAQNMHDHARALAPSTPRPEADPAIPLAVRPVGNVGFEPVIFVGDVSGDPVEILGRDELRDTVDVTNQSGLLIGKPTTLFLFRRQADAETFVRMVSQQNLTRALSMTPRACVLPDGAGRTLTHTAPVFAVAVDIALNGATQWCADVAAERTGATVRSGRD